MPPAPPTGVVTHKFSTRINVDGTDLGPYDVIPLELTPWRVRGVGEFRFARVGQRLANAADPYAGKLVKVYTTTYTYTDGSLTGTAETHRFTGQVGGPHYHYQQRLGWSAEYRAVQNKAFGDHVPVWDDQSQSNVLRYNLDPRDPAYFASRAGRTVGQVLISALEQDATVAGLRAWGLGSYTSTGSGAAADGIVVDGALAGAANLVGGTGYTTAPSVVVVGGNPAVRATAHCTVSSGVVTAVVVDTAGSGYQWQPVFVFSRLPTATLTDLTSGIFPTFIDPRPVSIAGDRLFQAIEGFLGRSASNYWLHVEPDGTLRFLDLRAPGVTATDIILHDPDDPDGPRWDPATADFQCDLENCGSRLQLYGASYAEMKLLKESAGDILDYDAHDGLTDAQARAAWKLSDYEGPITNAGQASGNAGLSGSAVASITPQVNGYGYTPSTNYTVSFSGGGGTGAAGYGTSNATGQITAYTVTAGGSGYTSSPTVTVPPPPGQVPMRIYGTVATVIDANTVRIQPDGYFAAMTWAANALDQTLTGRHATVNFRQAAGAGVTQVVTRKVTACTALVAGGTADLTLDFPLDSLTYNTFDLIGAAAGGSLVYRRKRLANAALGKAQAQAFSRPTPLPNADGTAASSATTPDVRVLFNNTSGVSIREQSVGFTIDPDSGVFTLNQPSVLVAGSRALLEIGGAAVDGVPDDVHYYGAFSSGKLRVTSPADVGGVAQYAGQVSALGYYPASLGKRTLYVECPDWTSPDNGSGTQLATLASELLDAYKDPVWTGSLTYRGFHEGSLTPHKTWNVKLPGNDVTGSAAHTPWEGLALYGHEPTLRWNTGAGDGSTYETAVRLSNKKDPLDPGAAKLPRVSAPTLSFDLGSAFGPGASGPGAGSGGPVGAWDLGGNGGRPLDLGGGAADLGGNGGAPLDLGGNGGMPRYMGP